MKLRSQLVQYAREISKLPFFANGIRWLILNLNSLFLGKKIYQNEHLFVVKHPKPAYPIHFLILPKEKTASIIDVKQGSKFWNAVPEVIQYLVKRFISDDSGYRIVANGGAYQEIPILHLHFISGENNE